MLEYIFFNQKTCELFFKSAISSGINVHSDYNDGYFTVRLDEDSNENSLENLENYYDELMDIDKLLTESKLAEEHSDSAQSQHAAGITIQLKDGRNVYASIRPELLNRVLKCISPEELNSIVNAITEVVETPDKGGLCQS